MEMKMSQNKPVIEIIKEDRITRILLVSIVGLSVLTVFSFVGADYFDDVAEKQYIMESDPCSLTNYIGEGNKEQIRTFASFSFSYNNETGNYDQEKVSFTISKELVPLAESRYAEECVEIENETD
jgi:hypothetical protein